MTPQAAKSKGRRLQQDVRDLLLRTFPQLDKDDIRSTAMGQTGEDVQLSPAARRLFPYQIECKNKARSQVHTWFEQAVGHGDHEPVLIVKQDRSATLAVVRLEHFVDLVKNNNEN